MPRGYRCRNKWIPSGLEELQRRISNTTFSSHGEQTCSLRLKHNRAASPWSLRNIRIPTLSTYREMSFELLVGSDGRKTPVVKDIIRAPRVETLGNLEKIYNIKRLLYYQHIIWSMKTRQAKKKVTFSPSYGFAYIYTQPICPFCLLSITKMHLNCRTIGYYNTICDCASSLAPNSLKTVCFRTMSAHCYLSLYILVRTGPSVYP